MPKVTYTRLQARIDVDRIRRVCQESRATIARSKELMQRAEMLCAQAAANHERHANICPDPRRK